MRILFIYSRGYQVSGSATKQIKCILSVKLLLWAILLVTTI
uniref:Uncharacterized protein n=1 Tax=Anguilla anguilla TaxID=7936 RepID=A0A0E9SS76_ANGAN